MNPSPFEYLSAFFHELERLIPSAFPRHAITWEAIEDDAPGSDERLLLQKNLGDCYFPFPLTSDLLDSDPVLAARAVAAAAQEDLRLHPDRVYEYRR